MMTDYQNKLATILPQEGTALDVPTARMIRKELVVLKRSIVAEKKERSAGLRLVYPEIKKLKEFIKANVKKRIRKAKTEVVQETDTDQVQ